MEVCRSASIRQDWDAFMFTAQTPSYLAHDTILDSSNHEERFGFVFTDMGAKFVF